MLMQQIVDALAATSYSVVSIELNPVDWYAETNATADRVKANGGRDPIIYPTVKLSYDVSALRQCVGMIANVPVLIKASRARGTFHINESLV